MDRLVAMGLQSHPLPGTKNSPSFCLKCQSSDLSGSTDRGGGNAQLLLTLCSSDYLPTADDSGGLC